MHTPPPSPIGPDRDWCLETVVPGPDSPIEAVCDQLARYGLDLDAPDTE